MYTAITWVVLALFPVLCSRRDTYVFPVKAEIENYWHAIGWCLRAAFAYFACPGNFLIEYAFYFWIMFDGTYNKFTNRRWGFIGTTSEFDKILRKVGGNWPKFAGFGIAIGFRIFQDLI